jgi:predicted RNase H-like HicB family nuclease
MLTVEVTYHHEDGSWWAESDDVPGFSALGSSLTETRERVRSGLAFHLQTDEFDLREAYAATSAVFTASLSGVAVTGSSSGSQVLVSATSAGAAPPADYRLSRASSFGAACPA